MQAMQSTCQNAISSVFIEFLTLRILSLRYMKLIIRILISTLAVLITSYFLPGVHLNNVISAIIVAVVLGCLNAVLKPILILFSLPAVIFTLGLFLVVINTVLILLTDKLIDGFHVDGFWWALLFSVLLSIVTSILNNIQKRDGQAG